MPEARVLAVAGAARDPAAEVLAAVRAGATGYVVSGSEADVLADAVRRTAAGEAVFPPGLAETVLAARGGCTRARPRLTPREADVLRFVVDGLTARQIATRLVLSPRTVEHHIHRMLRRLAVPNRAALVRRLTAVQREAAARPFALALIGLNGLDTDVLTPTTETTALRAITARLTRGLRGEDWLARGKDGDFVVLVVGSIADAEVVAARLVAAVGPVPIPGGSLRLSAVAGVTALFADVDTGEALRRGDLALRSAATAGPGSVHRYDDALRVEEDRRATLRADLDGALDRGELRLVFQPVVDVVMNRAVSVEALLRWRHPLFGDVSPTEFVPLAEESPLITDLGRWVMHEACTTIAALGDTGPHDERLSVAVNVSARQVRSGELVPDVINALEISGLPSSRLIVEITESVLLDDSHVIEDLTVLRQLGVRIAVDDFGTGWSSLAYLVGMPVDVLKMDQYFLSDVEHDPARRAMCRAVLQLGTSLDLPVIVEGVTNEAVLTLLRDMGHRYVQGYVFARPLEAAQLAAGAWDVKSELPGAVPATGTVAAAGSPAMPS
jgi:EAL domain-containing protein (putative c-di-GMP-specific phosphodiesterase class I)/DNA-binding CsgD family transcriptional regulator